MRMAEAAGFVFQAFHVCRLDTVFRFFATVDEACKARSCDAEREQHPDCRR